MANKKFTPEEMAILKANPYVLEVTEDIIHFSASFKSSFWDRLQNGMKPPDIFRELGIDPNLLGTGRVSGFKGMLKHEVLAGKGFRDLNTCKEYYAKNMTTAQRIAYLEQQLEYKDQEIEFLKKIVSLHQGSKG